MDSPDSIAHDLPIGTNSLVREFLLLEIDAELDIWLAKQAEEDGVDPGDPYAGEAEVIQRFQQDPTPEDFEWLYNVHKPLINDASFRYVSTTTLPKAAVKAHALQWYTKALQTYDPNKVGQVSGKTAQFKTHLFNTMQRVGRYAQKYSNVGRVAEGRAGLIPLLQDTELALTDSLGRPPTDPELADEMLLAAQDVADLKKKSKHITVANVGTLRTELRKDMTAESSGGDVEVGGDSEIRRRAVFLHGSLNADQQLVLEHTFEGFGKPIITDDVDLGKAIGLSPQKVRSIKAFIRKKVEQYW